MYQAKPTITETESFFNPTEDAQVLRTAMKGMGTHERALINFLCNRTAAQRVKIIKSFKHTFGKEGNWRSQAAWPVQSTCGHVAKFWWDYLLTPRFEYLAKSLHDAIDGLGTKETPLIGIICTSSNDDIKAIKEAYKRTSLSSLEDDVIGDTSGDFQRILVSLLNGSRDQDNEVVESEAESDAQALFDTGEGQWGTDESVFTSIMKVRSLGHLRQVFSKYQGLCGRSMEESVKREFSGDIKNALLAIIKCVHSPAAYFAERLRNAMVGLGTDDETLIFILVSRCDIDLENIKDEYEAMYGKPLGDKVKSETSGDYRKALRRLLGEPYS